jgi:hypothetical protein
MPTVFAKLNFKDQPEVVIVNAPDTFSPELSGLNAKVLTDMKKAKVLEFVVLFVTAKEELERLAPLIGRRSKGDAVIWVAYPKSSSKKYKSGIKRGDDSWKSMGAQGFEPVRMIAIDEDWSAVRFRRVEFIKNMTRPDEYRLTARR